MVYGGVSELQSRLFGDLTIELLGDHDTIDAAVVDLRRTTIVTEVTADA